MCVLGRSASSQSNQRLCRLLRRDFQRWLHWRVTDAEIPGVLRSSSSRQPLTLVKRQRGDTEAISRGGSSGGSEMALAGQPPPWARASGSRWVIRWRPAGQGLAAHGQLPCGTPGPPEIRSLPHILIFDAHICWRRCEEGAPVVPRSGRWGSRAGRCGTSLSAETGAVLSEMEQSAEVSILTSSSYSAESRRGPHPAIFTASSLKSVVFTGSRLEAGSFGSQYASAHEELQQLPESFESLPDFH